MVPTALPPADRQHLDGTLDALQLDAARRAGRVGAFAPVERRPGHEDLALARESADPRGFVYADAGVVQAALHRRGFVHADAHARRETVRLAVLRQVLLDRDGAVDRGGGGVERNDEPVALMPDLLAAVRRDDAAERVVVPAHQALPGVVTDGRGELGGADDVAEEERARDARRARVDVLPQQRRQDARVAARADALERRPRRAQLQERAVLVAGRAQREREAHPRLRGLVRELELLPRREGAPQITLGGRVVAVREAQRAGRGARARTQ